MIGLTMCSGIGAPEAAAPWADWRFASEIEAFPRAVLQQRFGYRLPSDHNQGEPLLWGDMTEITPDLLRSRGIPLPDLIVAGTPCQAFSVAGARKGLEDPRGNLTLSFVEICHAVVAARPDGKLAVVWENVPGVLSDSGNAFGSFLGGLVGAMDAIVPSPRPARGRSNDHWRWNKGGKSPVLDDEGEETGEFVTVEPHHRLTWPGEGMVQGPRARAAWAVLDAQWFGVAQRRRRVFVVVDFGNCVDPAAVLLEPDRLRGDTPPRRETGERPAPTISARTKGGGGLGTDFDCDGGLIASTGDVAHCLNAGGMGRQDYETETMVAHALRGEGFDASEDGTGRGTPLVPVAFDCKGTEVQFSADGSHPTLRSMGHSNSHSNAGGHAAVAFDMRGRDGGAMPEGPHDTSSVRSAEGGSTRSYVAAPAAVAFQDRFRGDDGRGYDRAPPASEEVAGTLEAVKPWNVALPWAVRRLMPVECARLQGFSDDHTAITYRGKPAADGPQYKAHGNSMAVPVMRWILDRVRISMEGRE